MQHFFDVSIATKYGLNTAIFINNIAFWTEKNIANEKHYYDGRYWTYNTQKALCILFPYWSRKNLRTIIDKTVEDNLIIIGNYNKIQYDRTSWYALTDFGLSLYPSLINIQKVTKNEENINKINIGRKRPMEWPEPANGMAKTGQPIPDRIHIETHRERGKPVDNSKSSISFFPDEINEKLLQSFNLDLAEELESFKNRHKGKFTQYEFKRWITNSRKYKDNDKSKLSVINANQTRSTVKEYGPGHPSYDRLHAWNDSHAK